VRTIMRMIIAIACLCFGWWNGPSFADPEPCKANLYSKVGDKFVCVSGGWIVNDDTVISHGQFGAPIAKPEYAPITPGYGVGEGMRNGPSHGYPNLGGPPR
jgi:hypothetical protein